jgi:hypothetical protein
MSYYFERSMIAHIYSEKLGKTINEDDVEFYDKGDYVLYFIYKKIGGKIVKSSGIMPKDVFNCYMNDKRWCIPSSPPDLTRHYYFGTRFRKRRSRKRRSRSRKKSR